MFFDHNHYEEHLLSVWARNPEFAHNISVSVSPSTPCVTLGAHLFAPCLSRPSCPLCFRFLFFLDPAWPSVPGIKALGVGVRAVIPSPVGGPLCLSTGYLSLTPLFMIPLCFCPGLLPPNCPSPVLPNCPNPLFPTRPSPLGRELGTPEPRGQQVAAGLQGSEDMLKMG